MIEVKYGIPREGVLTSSERAQRIEESLKKHLIKNQNLEMQKVVEQGSDADFLIVYGQGPVTPGNLRENSEVQGDLNVYCRLNAVAAAAIYRRGLTTKIILTGGKTGGEDLDSEAGLMKDILVNEYSIPIEAIVVEDAAKNTLQNYANSLEMEGGIKSDSRVMHLAAPHHTARVHMMAKIFGLDGPTFSSEQVLRAEFDSAIRGDDYSAENNILGFDANQARIISQEMHILFNADDNPNFFQRAIAENRWTEGLILMPEYWIMQASAVKDPERFKIILENLQHFEEILPLQEIEEGVEIHPHPLGRKFNYQEEVLNPFLQRYDIDLSQIDLGDTAQLQNLMDRLRMIPRNLSPNVWQGKYGSEYALHGNPVEEWLPLIIPDIQILIDGLRQTSGKATLQRPELVRQLIIPADSWLAERGISLDQVNWNDPESLNLLKDNINKLI